jgi:hypothetical protein
MTSLHVRNIQICRVHEFSTHRFVNRRSIQVDALQTGNASTVESSDYYGVGLASIPAEVSVNKAWRLPPSVVTTAMHATAIKATISPYSTIVAPSSSRTKFFTNDNMEYPPRTTKNLKRNNGTPCKGPNRDPASVQDSSLRDGRREKARGVPEERRAFTEIGEDLRGFDASGSLANA